MAAKGWTSQVATAAGVAAGTGAAQLGLGYGLGVVQWPTTAADDSVWLGSLGWATWIAASATVFGAVIAGRLGRTAGGPWRFALSVSAAVGALLTVALIALPARSAVRPDTFSPQTTAGGYAVIGVLLGLVIAYWAVVSRPVAANLIATATWLWALAVAAVVATIFWHRPSATYLSSWQFVSPDSPDRQYGTISWPSAVLTLLAALVVGIIGAIPVVRRGDRGIGAAASGAVGPLLVAAAFFALAPQLSGAPGPLQSAYLIAPYAVLAGMAGSSLVVAFGQRGAARRAALQARAAGTEAGVAGAGAPDDGVPGAVRRDPATAEIPGAFSGDPAAGGVPGDFSGSRAADGKVGAVGGGPAAVGAVSARARRADTAGKAAAVPAPRPASSSKKSSARAEGAGEGQAGRVSGGSQPTSSPMPADAAGAVSASGGTPASGGTSAAVGADEAGDAGSGRQRRSFLDRFRRGPRGAADPDAVATGRAKAPASSTAPAPEQGRSAGAVSARNAVSGGSAGVSSTATGSPAAGPAPTGPGTAGSGTAGSGPAAESEPATASGPATGSAVPAGRAATGSAATASGPARPGGAGAGEPAAFRPGSASVDGNARPGGSSAPGRSDTRSTVAPPPAAPPVAKINEPRSGETRSAPRKSAAAPRAAAQPRSADAASSDKTAPPAKTAAKSAKSAPARASAPAKANTTRATPSQAGPASAATPRSAAEPPGGARSANAAAMDPDTVELPVQAPKRRPARKPTDDQTP